MKLREKQKRFADYYIETGNQLESYLKAGYAVKSNAAARVNASRLLTNANVKSYIDERLMELQGKRVADQQEILQFLTSVMRGEVVEKIPLGVGMGEQILVENEPPINVRKSAAELLGKRYAMWTDKRQIDGVIGVQIVDDIGGDIDDSGKG